MLLGGIKWMIFVISMDLFSGDKTCYCAFDVISTCLISLLDTEIYVCVCVSHSWCCEHSNFYVNIYVCVCVCLDSLTLMCIFGFGVTINLPALEKKPGTRISFLSSKHSLPRAHRHRHMHIWFRQHSKVCICIYIYDVYMLSCRWWWCWCHFYT